MKLLICCCLLGLAVSQSYDGRKVVRSYDGDIVTLAAKKGWRHDQWLKYGDYSCITIRGAFPAPKIQYTYPHTIWGYDHERPSLFTNYKCKWGFIREGESENLYCHNGKWFGPAIPRCIRYEYTREMMLADQPSAERTTHADWLSYADYTCMKKRGVIQSPDVEHSTKVARHAVIAGRPHMYIEYRCDAGYQLEAGQFLYCKSNGWEGTNPKCVMASSRSDDKAQTPSRDPCENNGGCSQNCTVVKDHAVCSCRTGFRLSPDAKTCIQVNECQGPSGKGYQECTQNGFRCKPVRTEQQFKCVCPRRKEVQDGKCVRPASNKRGRRGKGKGRGRGRGRGKGRNKARGKGQGRRAGKGQGRRQGRRKNRQQVTPAPVAT